MKGIGIDTSSFAKIKKIEELVKESLKRILLTKKGERPGNFLFGIGLQYYLFSNINYLKSEEFKQHIIEELKIFEPRININNIKVNQTDINSVSIVLNYSIKEEYWEDEILKDQTLEIQFRGQE